MSGNSQHVINNFILLFIVAAEMKMLRWSTVVTKMGQKLIKNEVTRGKMKVRKISEKITEGRLRWFGHVERRGPECCAKLTDDVNLEGRCQRGRPSLRWNDKIKEDLKRLGALKEEALNRTKWRETICMAARPQVIWDFNAKKMMMMMMIVAAFVNRSLVA